MQRHARLLRWTKVLEKGQEMLRGAYFLTSTTSLSGVHDNIRIHECASGQPATCSPSHTCSWQTLFVDPLRRCALAISRWTCEYEQDAAHEPSKHTVSDR